MIFKSFDNVNLDDYNAIVTDVTGRGVPEIDSDEVTTDFKDGATYIPRRFKPRYLKLTFTVWGDTADEATSNVKSLIEKLSESHIEPKKLYFGDTGRYVYGQLYGTPIELKRNTPQFKSCIYTVTASFICKDPYAYSDTEKDDFFVSSLSKIEDIKANEYLVSPRRTDDDRQILIEPITVVNLAGTLGKCDNDFFDVDTGYVTYSDYTTSSVIGTSSALYTATDSVDYANVYRDLATYAIATHTYFFSAYTKNISAQSAQLWFSYEDSSGDTRTSSVAENSDNIWKKIYSFITIESLQTSPVFELYLKVLYGGDVAVDGVLIVDLTIMDNLSTSLKNYFSPSAVTTWAGLATTNTITAIDGRSQSGEAWLAELLPYCDSVATFGWNYSDGASNSKIYNRGKNILQTSEYESEYLTAAGIQLLKNDWTIGSGSVGMYSINGDTSENYRVYGTGPNGSDVILWECRPDSSSGADGGWDTSDVNIDKTKTYRFSVFMKTSASTGNSYLGCKINSVCNLNTTAENGNPYFWSGDLPSNDKWYLIVGYVFPYNTTGLSNCGGIWDCTTGEEVTSGLTCFNWADVSVTNHRCYHYHDTTTSTRQWMWEPRIDLVDGNEPLVAELIMGTVGWNYSEGTSTDAHEIIKLPAGSYILSSNNNNIVFSAIDALTAETITVSSGAFTLSTTRKVNIQYFASAAGFYNFNVQLEQASSTSVWQKSRTEYLELSDQLFSTYGLYDQIKNCKKISAFAVKENVPVSTIDTTTFTDYYICYSTSLDPLAEANSIKSICIGENGRIFPRIFGSSESLRYYCTGNTTYITIEKTKIDAMEGDTTLAQAQAYFAAYPHTLIYQLATPTVEDLSYDGELMLHPGINYLVPDSELLATEINGKIKSLEV